MKAKMQKTFPLQIKYIKLCSNKNAETKINFESTSSPKKPEYIKNEFLIYTLCQYYHEQSCK